MARRSLTRKHAGVAHRRRSARTWLGAVAAVALVLTGAGTAPSETVSAATEAASIQPAARPQSGPATGGDPASVATAQQPDFLLLDITVASSRPDMVTGGDALVEVKVPFWVKPSKVKVFAGSRNVTEVFDYDPARKTLVGVVDELPEGSTSLSARTGLLVHDRVTVTNHPGQGPLFAGPHEQPFYCETHDFAIPVIGGTLGEALDDDCSVADRVDYFYRSTGGSFVPWQQGTSEYPSDLASTTTSTGAQVPFIVRMETGTANRGIYQHTVLHDPIGEEEPTPVARPAGWNERIIYTLGGGCAGGWYRQGAGTGGVTDAHLLGQGYALVSSSLNVFGNNCNDLLASETAAMTKEVFLQRYGRDRHTIGFGCSGGSYQAHQTADNYPGIFDGIVVGCSFPEVGFGTINFITDARLLQHYFAEAELDWTLEEQRQVTGFANLETMNNVAGGAQRIDPRVFCGIVPEEVRYHPQDNPDGVRCDYYDHTVNVFGTDPGTGFALRPLDNGGIQYGLVALQDGTISVDQFLDLNTHIGGYDHDANFVDTRTQADAPAVEAAYRSGRLTNGGLGLATTPIIDYRAYTDDLPAGDIHVRYHTNSMRQRLIDANGHAGNQVSVLEDNRYGGFSTQSPLLRSSISQMDDWLTALNLGKDRRPSSSQVVNAKPAGLVDGCMSRDETPQFVVEPLDRDPSTQCEQWYPSASFPREVAGEPVQADTIVCHTREPERSQYPEMTDDQWLELTEIFAAGVCDYTLPGVDQQEPDGTWQRF